MGGVWGYSAAWRAVLAIESKASATRSANPGLLGRKPVNISLGMPFDCASLNNRVRPLRNRAASIGPPKSATFTAQAVSYSVHSGLRSSGFSDGSSRFVCIGVLFPAVGLSKRYNAQFVFSQNKYQNVKPFTNHTARHKTLFAIFRALVSKCLCGSPIESCRICKVQAAFKEVTGRLCFIPFRFHLHQTVPISCGNFEKYHNLRNRRKSFDSVDKPSHFLCPLSSGFSK